MRREFLTLSNVLSISRVLLVIPFVIVMLPPGPPVRWAGALLLALAALTDKLDGVFARKFKQETEWGKILDPLADKIGVAAVAMILLWLETLPLWFFLVLIFRDLLIFSGGLFLKASRGVVLTSIPAGKWAVGVVTLALLAGIVGAAAPALAMLIWLSTAMSVVSLALYVKRFVDTVSTPSH